MKKFILASLLIGAASMMAQAQTEFRNISFDEGLAAAKQENKMVFIDFFTTWCGPCKKLSSEVFPDKSVGEYMNKTFVCLKMDAEKEGAELAKKYEVKAYPTMVILNDKGEVVTKVVGYTPASGFVENVQAQLDPEQQPARIKARYEAGERTPKLVDRYAMSLFRDRKGEEGMKVIDDFYKSLSDADRLKAENAFVFLTYTNDMDSDRGQFMIANRDKFAPEKAEEINKLIGQMYHSQLQKYFSGYMYRENHFEQEAFDQLKSEINALGLNADGKYEPVYAFIQARADTDEEADYLDYIIKNIDKLGVEDQNMIIYNITRLVNPEDAEIKASMSKFLRGRLSTMSPVAIQFAGRTLGSIEEK